MSSDSQYSRTDDRFFFGIPSRIFSLRSWGFSAVLLGFGLLLLIGAIHAAPDDRSAAAAEYADRDDGNLRTVSIPAIFWNHSDRHSGCLLPGGALPSALRFLAKAGHSDQFQPPACKAGPIPVCRLLPQTAEAAPHESGLPPAARFLRTMLAKVRPVRAAPPFC